MRPAANVSLLFVRHHDLVVQCQSLDFQHQTDAAGVVVIASVDLAAGQRAHVRIIAHKVSVLCGQYMCISAFFRTNLFDFHSYLLIKIEDGKTGTKLRTGKFYSK